MTGLSSGTRSHSQAKRQKSWGNIRAAKGNQVGVRNKALRMCESHSNFKKQQFATMKQQLCESGAPKLKQFVNWTLFQIERLDTTTCVLCDVHNA